MKSNEHCLPQIERLTELHFGRNLPYLRELICKSNVNLHTKYLGSPCIISPDLVSLKRYTGQSKGITVTVLPPILISLHPGDIGLYSYPSFFIY